MAELKKIPIQFKELMKVVPGTIADPVPFFVKLLDENKLRDFVKLELEYKMNDFKNKLEITEKMSKLL